jgi:hypothetical protein
MRIGQSHRAGAVEAESGLVWIWIRQHDPSERKLS